MRNQFNKTLRYAGIFLIILFIAQACERYYTFRSNYKDTNRLLHETQNLRTKPFLKAHLKNGDVCIFKDTWQIDSVQNTISGYGICFDYNRIKKKEGSFIISTDSVAIFETNKKIINPEQGRIAALSVLAGVDVAFSIFCLTNPKACFGSCPTFYMNENDNFHYSDAEGFSNAIAPCLEYGDYDALNNKKTNGKEFSITMKNEALETHCVREVKLFAYPRNKNERVYQSRQNDFYLCENSYQVSKAIANEGDITSLLRNDEKQERFSPADANNLNSREEIYLTFNNVSDNKNLGLIAGFRQTLMTTYFIYSAIGYMGDEVGDIFAKIENSKDPHKEFGGSIIKDLGDIDVYVWNTKSNTWDFQGGWNETGPIATNHQIIPFKNTVTGSDIRIKLILNKGLWRLDYFALTNIKEKVTPVEISPCQVLNKNKIDTTALSLINNPEKYLISMPGSNYKFKFILPEQNQDYELFLYSKGYYLEWMREHWIKDKNLLALRKMIVNSKKYLKQEAPAYKKYESEMEQEFWSSKIDTKNFSYYEK